MFCEKPIADSFDLRSMQAAGAVPIPFFGTFCSQDCANAFEHEYGIHFKRDATGEVSYDN
jgi:hypothetical protein